MQEPKCKTCGQYDVLDSQHDECWRCTYRRNPQDPALKIEDETADWDEDELGEIESNRQDRHAFFDDEADDPFGTEYD